MKFFQPRDRFTHTARFYGIPVYIDLTDEIPIISGTNIIYDKLFSFMIFIHNNVIETAAQLLAAIFNLDYEAGFPIYITGEIQHENRK